MLFQEEDPNMKITRTKQYHTVPTRVRKGRVATDNDKTRGRSEHIVWYLVLKIERKECHTILSDSHTLPVDDAVGYFSRHRQELAYVQKSPLPQEKSGEETSVNRRR